MTTECEFTQYTKHIAENYYSVDLKYIGRTTLVNSADRDQTALQEQSNLGLHFCNFALYFTDQ